MHQIPCRKLKLPVILLQTLVVLLFFFILFFIFLNQMLEHTSPANHPNSFPPVTATTISVSTKENNKNLSIQGVISNPSDILVIFEQWLYESSQKANPVIIGSVHSVPMEMAVNGTASWLQLDRNYFFLRQSVICEIRLY